MHEEGRVKRRRPEAPRLELVPHAVVPGEVVAASRVQTVYCDGCQLLTAVNNTAAVLHPGPIEELMVAVCGVRAVVVHRDVATIFTAGVVTHSMRLNEWPSTAVALTASQCAVASASRLMVDGTDAPAARAYCCLAFGSASVIVAASICNVYALRPNEPEAALFSTGGEAIEALAVSDNGRVAVATSGAVLVVNVDTLASFAVQGLWSGVAFDGPFVVCTAPSRRIVAYSSTGGDTIETTLPHLRSLMPDAPGSAALCTGSDATVHTFGNDTYWVRVTT